MKWNREEYLSHMLCQGSKREMFCELFGPLHPLINEWRAQGATQEEIDLVAFDWDYVPVIILGANTGSITGIQPVLLKDTPEETLAIDRMGRHTRLIKASATIPLPSDFPLTEEDDFEKVRHWYTFGEDRVDRESLKQAKKERDAGGMTVLCIPGAFDELRELLGEIGVGIACYENPQLLHAVLDTVTDTVLQCIERVSAMVPIDLIAVHEDMAGKSGPLVGPGFIREFFYPYYSRVFAAAKATGTQVFSMDSDGDISLLIPELMRCGLNAIHPCEPVGGMDIVQLRKTYGRGLQLKGGIDKHVLCRGKQAIREELERRITSETLGGGTVFALDHRIPNGVPIENYRYYVALGREMLGLPPVSGKGWARMAF